MLKADYIITENRSIADGVYLMTLRGDTSAIKKAGQCADVAIEGYFLRRPLAVTEWDAEKFSMVYKVVGEGTAKMALMKEGQSLNVLTGLGNGWNAEAASSAALVVCGGIGASPCFSLVKDLVGRGVKTTVVLGYNRACDIILEQEYRALGAEVIVATMDGSRGIKGLVTDAIAQEKPEFDHFYTCGPKPMMKAVCEALAYAEGEVSLEERMGCGCGICYGCTCHTTEGARRVCADGPVFRKEEVIW